MDLKPVTPLNPNGKPSVSESLNIFHLLNHREINTSFRRYLSRFSKQSGLTGSNEPNYFRAPCASRNSLFAQTCIHACESIACV